MSIPFRFKAGGAAEMAPIQPQVHHHRSTTKVDHKPFKSRFASKGELKDQAKGKIESRPESRGKRRTPYQQVMSKLARRNQAKQLRSHHKERQEQESRIFQGTDGAPKHVAVVPLAADVDVQAAIHDLNESMEVEAAQAANGTIRARVDRFRRNLLYLPAKFDLMNALDVCKLADWVVFVVHPHQGYDEVTSNLLLAVESQGITSFAAVVQNFEQIVPAPKRIRHLIELKLALGRYLPTLDKISNLDSKSDCTNLVRSVCTASAKGIKWRDDRSWMLVESVTWSQTASKGDSSSATLSGIVRGKGLNPDRLVHVPGWGDLKIKSIRQIPLQGRKRKADEMAIEEVGLEWGPTSDQDDLDELAPETTEINDAASTVTMDQKGVLLDDHHYFSDDNSHLPPRPKKLPEGTSSYQAAWYLDDVSDSESELEEDDDGDLKMVSEELLQPEDGVFTNRVETTMDAGVSEYPESEMHIDADEAVDAKQLEEYRSSRKREVEEDLEFPDEIELHPETAARERLAKYRGLKSLRTSEWNSEEDAPFEPPDYRRLLKVAYYKKSSNTARKEALAGGVPAGTRVEVELADVSASLKAITPSSMFSLLRHEHKHSVINLSVSLRTEAEDPVRSKDELVIQIGHRKLVINPIHSASGQTPNDVHKFDRFLHPGCTGIATFTGPVTWGAVPVLVFRRDTVSDNEAPALVDSMNGMQSETGPLKLIGTATTTPPSPSRVIAKRIILTGHPYKIHKKLVTVRYMFFNREDVTWFAALPLWTKRGRQGFIKEPLGTHGYFKATFDGRINPMDAVGVSLYKRVWPRPARRFEA